MRVELRDYQEDARQRTIAAEIRGVRRQLGVAATGLGKTIMFSAIAAHRGGRALVLAHRDELVSQAAEKLAGVWPEASIGIVKAGDNHVRADVVIASVQTLARANRLDQLCAPWERDQVLHSPLDRFTTVIVDEAHHAAATSYRTILDRLAAGTETGPLLVGVTATPDRGDGKGLDDLFDEIVWSYDLLWGIRAGFLCDVRGLQIRLAHLDLHDVKVTRGDYAAGQSGAALADAGAPDAVVRAWRQHAEGRRTIVFTPTVELARQTAAAYIDAGITAAMISADTDRDIRRSTLRKFSAGEITVIANCAVLTEGYDEPRVDCIVVARPTKSRALYTQMVGRGTRRHPDKEDCLILDVVGATEEHSLVTIPSLFGLEGAHRKQMGNGTGKLTAVMDDHEQKLVSAGRLSAERAELFRKMRGAGIAWVHAPYSDGRDRYTRPCGTGKPVVMVTRRHPEDDIWTAGLLMPNGEKRILMANVTLEMAQGIGEDYVRKSGSFLGNADAAWRSNRPSKKQRAFAKRLKIKVDPSWSAGQISDEIDRRMLERRESSKETVAAGR